MIKYAGLGVAMGNAQPPIKAQADLVLPHTNDEDGVAHFVKASWKRQNDELTNTKLPEIIPKAIGFFRQFVYICQIIPKNKGYEVQIISDRC